jgi:PEGA domain
MKTLTLPILTAFVLAAAPSSAQTAPNAGKPAPAGAKGKVNIVCNPSCDDVVISGRSYGPSPVVRAELPAGSYEVTLKRKSQADTRKQLVVESGQTASLNFALTTQAAPTAPSAEMAARLAANMRAADGWLNIQCDLGCDDVVVDGKRSLGKNTTNVALPPGEHQITGKRKGSADKTIKVRVVGGQTAAVRLKMEATVTARVDTTAAKRK